LNEEKRRKRRRFSEISFNSWSSFQSGVEAGSQRVESSKESMRGKDPKKREKKLEMEGEKQKGPRITSKEARRHYLCETSRGTWRGE